MKTFYVLCAIFGVYINEVSPTIWPGLSVGEGSSSNFQTADILQCSCTKEVKALEKQSLVSYGRLETMQHRMDELSAELYQMQNGMRALSTSFRPASLSQVRDVSFSARVGTNQLYLKSVDTIIFDDITVNNANAYDPYTGKFTAPFIGVYYFQSTILSGFNTTIETMFVVNGNEMGRMYSGAFNNRGSGSNSVVVNLKQGDVMYVGVFFGNGDYVHGQWSSFSGFAITLFN